MRAWLIPAPAAGPVGRCWSPRPGCCSVPASRSTSVSSPRWPSASPWPWAWLSCPLGAPASARPYVRRHWLVDSPAPVVTAATLAFVLFATASAAAFPLRHLGQQSPEPWFGALEKSLAGQDRTRRHGRRRRCRPFVLYAAGLGFYEHVPRPVRLRPGALPRRGSGRLLRRRRRRAAGPARPGRRALCAVAPAPTRCGYPVRTDAHRPAGRPSARLRLARAGRLHRRRRTPRRPSRSATVDTDVRCSRPATHVLEMPGDAEYEARPVQRRRPGQRIVRLFSGRGFDPGSRPPSGLTALGRRA